MSERNPIGQGLVIVITVLSISRTPKILPGSSPQVDFNRFPESNGRRRVLLGR